jgi:hypothetical protein
MCLSKTPLTPVYLSHDGSYKPLTSVYRIIMGWPFSSTEDAQTDLLLHA